MSAAWVWIIAGPAATVILVLIVRWIWRRHIALRVRSEVAHLDRLKSAHLDRKTRLEQEKIWREHERLNVHADYLRELPPGARLWELLLSPDEAASRAVTESIKKGLLMFNPPTEMIQGHKERVEVRIARSADLREELISGLRGSGEPQFEEIDTSFYMEVKLAGLAFEITSYSPPEQIIIPAPARWEFDLMPRRAGHQKITLSVNMRVEAKGIVGGRRGVSVLEKQIDIRVNVGFATRRFVSNNWQWLVPAALTLAGTVAAWLVVPF
jgi:hypothetical protein